MQESCIDRFDAIDCRAAVNFCDSTMGAAFQASGKFTQRDCQIETSKSDTLCNFRRTQLLRHLQGSPTYTYSHKPRLSALQPCLGDLCYLEAAKIKDYLNTPETRTLLGVESPNNFTSCSSDVGRAFNSHLDKYAVPAHFHVAALLERGVRVLIYAGTYDWQCNWVANKLFADRLECVSPICLPPRAMADPRPFWPGGPGRTGTRRRSGGSGD